MYVSGPTMRRVVPFLLTVSWAVVAHATEPPTDVPPTTETRDVRSEAPIVAYAYSATGATAGTVGAQAYGLGLAASRQRATLGGGVTAWGSPIDRLTLVGDGARDIFGNFAPSAAAVVRLFGRPGDGFSLGALGKFKVDGFGVGPNDEIESEVESGLLLSYAKLGWHLDLNAIGGMGLGDDGEVDAEARARFGRDIGSLLRVGLDGQARMRVAGATKLVGGRTWDFAGGPQVLVGSGHFFGAVTGGPATMGVAAPIVGWTSIVSFGGTTL
jgi:hypothetical protein